MTVLHWWPWRWPWFWKRGKCKALVCYRGQIDCSSNPNYPVAHIGQLLVVSKPGKIGGASGIDVETQDSILCIKSTTTSGDQAAVGSSWIILQGNIDGSSSSPSTGETFTTAEKTKLSNIQFNDTNNANLDNLRTDIDNNAAEITSLTTAVNDNTVKVSNATHTGDVTGSTALTIDPSAITGKTGVDPSSGDFVLGSDSSDSDNLKKFDVGQFISGGPIVKDDLTASQVIAGTDLGKGKLISLGSSTGADSVFTLPSTAGLSLVDSISFYNNSDHQLKVNLADSNDKINGVTTERTLLKGQGILSFYPLDAENTWASK